MAHIVIGGTGRAGTTLLVQVFTALGLDTGYSLEEAVSNIDAISQAGLEANIDKDARPHVLKAPTLSENFARLLDSGALSVEALILPMRDLFEAAESRRRVYREASRAGKDPRKHPGTVWKTPDPAQQELYLAYHFYLFVHPAVRHEIPIYFLDFPRFAKDAAYLYDKLAPLLESYGIDEARVAEALKRVARPDRIHDLSDRPAERAKSGWLDTLRTLGR